MLIIRLTSNRTLFIDEFWVLIPTVLLVELLTLHIINTVRNKRKRHKKLKQEIERRERIRRICLFAMNMNTNSINNFIARGGAELNKIDPDQILEECGLEPGVFNLEQDAIITELYKYFGKKAKKFLSNGRIGRVIYITGTALCHFIRMYGAAMLQDTVIKIGNFAVATSSKVLIEKAKLTGVAVTAVLGILEFIRARFFAAPGAGLVGNGGFGVFLLLGYQAWRMYKKLPPDHLSKLDLDDLSTVDELLLGTRCLEDIGPRKPSLDEVMVISNREKGKSLTNPLAPMETEMGMEQSKQAWPWVQPETDQDLSLVRHGLDAEKDVVTLDDVLQLPGSKFSDQAELGGLDEDCLRHHGKTLRRNKPIDAGPNGFLGDLDDLSKLPAKKPGTGAKMVNFKDKFPDKPSFEVPDFEEAAKRPFDWDELQDLIGYE